MNTTPICLNKTLNAPGALLKRSCDNQIIEIDRYAQILYNEPDIYPEDLLFAPSEDAIVLKDKPSEFEIHNNYNLKIIEDYKKALNISESEAFELLRRCHYCGSGRMEFGDEYCSPKCQDYHIDFNYPCYWSKKRLSDANAANCKICNHLKCTLTPLCNPFA